MVQAQRVASLGAIEFDCDKRKQSLLVTTLIQQAESSLLELRTVYKSADNGIIRTTNSDKRFTAYAMTLSEQDANRI
jgi:hypothetical protein